MTNMTGNDRAHEILKSDKLVRVQIRPERREAILDEFKRSGLSDIAFARHHGINYQTFAAWRQRRKKAAGTAPARTSGFVLVEPTREIASSHGVEIQLAGGTRISVRSRADAALAAELIRAFHP